LIWLTVVLVALVILNIATGDYLVLRGMQALNEINTR
jgi:hypothetical protein